MKKLLIIAAILLLTLAAYNMATPKKSIEDELHQMENIMHDRAMQELKSIK